MSTIVTNSANYYAIASAIREKLGTDDLFKPSEMAPAIRSISYYQKSISVLNIDIIANGTYRPEHVGYAFENVTVYVDTSVPLFMCFADRNGEYYPESGGLFGGITVDVPIVSLASSAISISQNGTYYPPDGYAFTFASIFVPTYSMLSLEVHRDGHYPIPASQTGRYLYNSVVVDVPAVDRADFYSVFNRQVSTVSCNDVTYIRPYAFYNNGAVYSVDFPNATTVASSAFCSCRNLQHVNMPKLRTVEAYAFQSCSYMRQISLPSCSTLSSGAFKDCNRLSSIYFLSTAVVYIQSFADVFSGTPFTANSGTAASTATLYVLESLLSTYKRHAQWKIMSSRIVAYSS